MARKSYFWHLRIGLCSCFLLALAAMIQALPQTQGLKGQVLTDQNAPIPHAVC